MRYHSKQDELFTVKGEVVARKPNPRVLAELEEVFPAEDLERDRRLREEEGLALGKPTYTPKKGGNMRRAGNEMRRRLWNSLARNGN